MAAQTGDSVCVKGSMFGFVGRKLVRGKCAVSTSLGPGQTRGCWLVNVTLCYGVYLSGLQACPPLADSSRHPPLSSASSPLFGPSHALLLSEKTSKLTGTHLECSRAHEPPHKLPIQIPSKLIE